EGQLFRVVAVGVPGEPLGSEPPTAPCPAGILPAPAAAGPVRRGVACPTPLGRAGPRADRRGPAALDAYGYAALDAILALLVYDGSTVRSRCPRSGRPPSARPWVRGRPPPLPRRLPPRDVADAGAAVAGPAHEAGAPAFRPDGHTGVGRGECA